MKQGLRDFLRGRLQTSGTLILAVLLAFALGCPILIASGESPLAAYSAMMKGAFGGRSKIASTLAKATPLILTGLAASVTSTAGILNLGTEGQLYIGGFAAALVGFAVKGLPAPVHVSMCILTAALAGGAWSCIAAALKVKGNTNEVVVTIMANYIAILLTGYLVNYPFKAPGSIRSATEYIQKTAELPRLVPFSRLSAGFLIAIALVLLLCYVMTKTTVGYEWKMVGLNEEFARYGGITTSNVIFTTMLVSGAIAGVAGAIEVMGVHQRFIDNLSPGYGFDGLLIALIAGNHPVRVLLVAALFGALRTGAIGMEQVTSVPSELSVVIQSLIILCAAVQSALIAFRASSGKEQSQ